MRRQMATKYMNTQEIQSIHLLKADITFREDQKEQPGKAAVLSVSLPPFLQTMKTTA